MLNYVGKSHKYEIQYNKIEQTGGNIFPDIKMMSWNILADAPIWKKKYESKKKEEFIYWDYRKSLILEIISKHEPDICLLCEVEYDKIMFFSKYCNENNYGYIYTSCEPPKSKESRTNYKDYTSAKNPGILILFKIDKLKLVNNLAPDYISYFINQQKENKWSEEELKLRLQQCASNIVLFEKLDETSNRFYFAGLHHPFIKDKEFIQDEQIEFLLSNIDKLNNNSKYPVIIAGDFNAKPTYKVYEIMNDKGYESAYKIANGVENLYTTTNSFTGQRMTLDYIFVNDQYRVKKVEPIDSDYLEKTDIPNNTYPSDHIHLIANIQV
jgi:mRNA deadenylase 3'-5' endonuclease subunit Ccr4